MVQLGCGSAWRISDKRLPSHGTTFIIVLRDGINALVSVTKNGGRKELRSLPSKVLD